MTYFQTHFNTPVEARLEDLNPQNLIIFSIISNLLVPTDNHRINANKMELYLFYCFLEKIRIDFGFVMCKFLLKISTDSRRKLFYEKFLTPIFAHFKIRFTGKSPKKSASTVFSKAYFERKYLKFFMVNGATRKLFWSLGERIIMKHLSPLGLLEISPCMSHPSLSILEGQPLSPLHLTLRSFFCLRTSNNTSYSLKMI